MDIYVDGVKTTTWTSSGSTTAFENVEVGVGGQTIELRGVLGDSEWLSITEVGAERGAFVGSWRDARTACVVARPPCQAARARAFSVTKRATKQAHAEPNPPSRGRLPSTY